jgi:hypothetical protein
MGPIRCPETSANNYHTTSCNYPEDNRFHQHRGGSLKSRLYLLLLITVNFYFQLFELVSEIQNMVTLYPLKNCHAKRHAMPLEITLVLMRNNSETHISGLVAAA